MAYRLDVVSANGERDHVAEFDELDVAMTEALKLANELGQRPPQAGERPPLKVAIYLGDAIILSVRITRGGLLRSKGFPKLRSI